MAHPQLTADGADRAQMAQIFYSMLILSAQS
jgi:hypothetical protein